jgi:hypothetical protein
MSNYTKSTNFTAKDGLTTGNPSKIIKGAEIDTEFTAIASAIASKADLNSPSLTGTPTAPTAASGTNTTQLATTAFVIANAVPSGLISMWSGSIASIPSGWVLCNGSNSTPDLRNRFIIGAHSDNVGVANTTITGGNTLTGGSKNSIVVEHTHTATTASSGAHTHTTPTGLSGTGSNFFIPTGEAINNVGSTTSSAGAHTHTVTVASTGDSGTNANLPPYYALAFIMKT